MTPKAEAKPVEGILPSDTTEAPIEAYQSREGRPYIVDMLDVANVYRETGLGDFVKSIDAYVLKQIEDRSLESTKKSYEAVISQLESELGLDENLSFDKRLEKLASYIIILTEQGRIDALRKSLLDA